MPLIPEFAPSGKVKKESRHASKMLPSFIALPSSSMHTKSVVECSLFVRVDGRDSVIEARLWPEEPLDRDCGATGKCKKHLRPQSRYPVLRANVLVL